MYKPIWPVNFAFNNQEKKLNISLLRGRKDIWAFTNKPYVWVAAVLVESYHFQDCDSLDVSWQFFNHNSVWFGLQPTSQYQPILSIPCTSQKRRKSHWFSLLPRVSTFLTQLWHCYLVLFHSTYNLFFLSTIKNKVAMDMAGIWGFIYFFYILFGMLS